MDVPNQDDPFRRLIKVVECLRSDQGCPWDREQTMKTMIEEIQEETEEVVEAVRKQDMENLKEELGDYLLQGVFYAQLASEKGLFDIDDVLDGISDKLVRRHPHVFGDVEIETVDEVLEQWETIKASEKS